MKISVKWLKDYISFNLPVEKLAHKLTMAGLEVEKIEAVGDDMVLDLEITPNRPDCLNFQGIARELAAVLDKQLKTPKIKKIILPKAKCAVEILDKKGCGRYIGTLIESVDVKESPSWLAVRLSALGNRTINNVVDITNFCLLETGQPLHAFDYDKLIGGKIVVRRARAGEKIVTLEGVERSLDPSILVIADAQRPVAIAGVMGGLETEVTGQTQRILLESAHFDPILIRKASRSLGIKTDSSYRFERGVDLATVEKAAARAASLILQQGQGKVTARKDAFPSRPKGVGRKIVIKVEDVNSLLGADLSLAKCRTILKKLDFHVAKQAQNVMNVTAPPSRPDIKDPVDVIEEIARVIGYDNLPLTLPLIKAQNVPEQEDYAFVNNVRELCIGLGFSEAISYALISRESLAKSGLSQLSGIKIINPLSLDQEIMRPSLLPSLLAVIKGNINRRQKDLKIFEVGKIYRGKTESKVLAILMTGFSANDWRNLDKRSVDFFDLKGVANQVLKRAGLKQVTYEIAEEPIFQKGLGAKIIVGKTELGWLGQVHKDVLQQWDIKSRIVFYAQIELEKVYKDSKRKKAFQSVSDFPAMNRDVSIAVKREVPYQRVRDIVLKQGGALLEEINFLEEYRGEKIPQGYRGLIFSLVYQSNQRTLVDDEVNKVHGQITQALVSELGGILR